LLTTYDMHLLVSTTTDWVSSDVYPR